MSKTRYEQYLICQDRGHVKSNVSADKWFICRKCETWYYYTEPELVEMHIPDEHDDEFAESTSYQFTDTAENASLEQSVTPYSDLQEMLEKDQVKSSVCEICGHPLEHDK